VSEINNSGLIRYIKAHKGLIIGSCIGFVIGALILWIGFFSTLFLAVCIGIGAFFGSNNKFRKRLFEILDRVLPDIFK
jgi:uncharacterized membrane protein